MASGERSFRNVEPELQPAPAGITPIDQTEAPLTVVAPVSKRDVLLAAGALSKRRLLLANGLPVANPDLLNRVDDEVYNPDDWKKGRVVSPREDIETLRADALANIAGYLLNSERSELPEGLNGPAVEELLQHLTHYIGDGNQETLAALIGNPQKAKALLHKSHGVQAVIMPKLTSSPIPTAITAFVPTPKLDA